MAAPVVREVAMNGPKNGALSHLPKQEPMPKVAICIPSGDTVHKHFAMCLAAMTYMTGPHGDIPAIPIALVGVEGSSIARNRNNAVKRAQGLGVDYLLFLDSDMIFPIWTLRCLLAHDVDIVGATYPQREPPHKLLGLWADDAVLTSDRIHQVMALPTGCLLIKMSVFDRMVKPYFRTPAHEGEDADLQGEDYYFCEQAHNLGIGVWLDPLLTLEMGHIGRQVVKVQADEIAEPIAAANEAHGVPDGQAAVH